MGVSLKDILKDNKKVFLPLGGFLVIIIIVLIASSTGFEYLGNSFDNLSSDKSFSKADNVLVSGKDYSAVIKTTYGDVTIDLFEDEVPVSVNNFVFLVGKDFYDGLIFHKVIKNFIIQTGDPSGNSTGDAGYLYTDIITDRKMEDYSVAMANAGNNDSNGSQFFIVCGDADVSEIDGEYTIFGEVTSGKAIVDSICNVSVDENYKPLNDVEIESVQILEN